MIDQLLRPTILLRPVVLVELWSWLLYCRVRCSGVCNSKSHVTFLVAIKYLKGSKAAPTDALSAPDESHQETPLSPGSQQPLMRQPSLTSTSAHSFKIDVILARCALAIEVCAYIFMATTKSGVLFVIGTIFGSASVAVPPICQATAVEIYSSRTGNGAGGGQGEVGRLFGAMSVVQAMTSVRFLIALLDADNWNSRTQIIGPALYGFVYSHTVATFPQAIMLVAAFNFTVAFVLLSFVKVPVPTSGGPIADRDTEEEGRGNEETREGPLVDIDERRVVS